EITLDIFLDRKRLQSLKCILPVPGRIGGTFGAGTIGSTTAFGVVFDQTGSSTKADAGVNPASSVVAMATPAGRRFVRSGFARAYRSAARSASLKAWRSAPAPA
ncbi:hypothetical protein, partial [Sphingomonas sp. Leaf62]|uniref:hypothetical protein n=1 Tax=Sphingomonas sp. Leaf62 TaxID=1736228 RepID=UPI001F467458